MSDEGTISAITEELLTHIEERISRLNKWDLPPVFIVLAGQTIGLTGIPRKFYEAYPDPVDLIAVLARGQRQQNERLKQARLLYRDEQPHEAASGEPYGVVAVVESWGIEAITEDGYDKLVAALGAEEQARLIAEHGRVPMSVLPGAREQRNVIALGWDGTVHSLVRYRDTDELSYRVEGQNAGYMSGRLIHSLIDWVFEIKRAWQQDRQILKERGE